VAVDMSSYAILSNLPLSESRQLTASNEHEQPIVAKYWSFSQHADRQKDGQYAGRHSHPDHR
jgi:hypothetical protein